MKFVLVLIIMSLQNLSLVAQSSWQKIDGLYGGSCGTIQINSQGHIFTNSNNNLYKSVDSGNSWTKTSDQQLFTFTIDKNDILYAILINYPASWRNHFLLKSTDNGSTWQEIEIPYAVYPYYLDTDSSGAVYICGKNNLMKYKNNDQEWEVLPFEFDDRNFTSIHIAENGYIFLGTYFANIFRSKDNGYTWENIYKTVDYYEETWQIVSEKYIVYAAFSGAIIASYNYGDTWTDLAKGTDVQYNSFYSVLPMDQNTLLTSANYSILRTKDYGSTWEDLETKTDITLTSNYLTITENNEVLAASEIYGVISSNDFGDTWDIKNSGINNLTFYAVHQVPDNSFLISSEAGLYKSSNLDHDFVKVLNGDYEGYKFKVLESLNRIYFYNKLGDIVYTDDLGESWQGVSLPFTKSPYSRFYIGNNDKFYFADYKTQTIYNSTNTENSWNEITKLTLDITSTLVVDKDENIYIGNYGSGLFIYNSNLKTFNKFIPQPDSTIFDYITALEISPTNDLYITANYNQLYTINFSDSTINQITKISPNVIESVGTILPLENGIIVLSAQSRENIYYSNNNGSTWTLIENKLPTYNINSLTYSSNILYASTQTGLFKTNFNTTAINESKIEVPSKIKLYQNYPNPFNPTTTLSFDLPKAAFVKLTVYDITGAEIKNIISQNMTAGYHTANFNAGNLSSGVYFYRLQTKDFSTTRKMIILK